MKKATMITQEKVVEAQAIADNLIKEVNSVFAPYTSAANHERSIAFKNLLVDSIKGRLNELYFKHINEGGSSGALLEKAGLEIKYGSIGQRIAGLWTLEDLAVLLLALNGRIDFNITDGRVIEDRLEQVTVPSEKETFEDIGETFDAGWPRKGE